MDVSKYNLTKVSSKYDNGLLVQVFQDNNIKYTRVAWSDDSLKPLVDMLFSTSKVISEIIPNLCKLEMKDNGLEILMYSDDDIDFRITSEMTPILKKVAREWTDELSGSNDIDEMKVTDLMNLILRSNEVKEKLMDIYSKYKDKEL